MSDVFKTESWALKVPDGWTIDDSEQAVAFVPHDGEDAALFVSAYFKDSEITMEDMRGSMQTVADDGAPFCEVQIGDFAGYYTSHTRRSDEGEAAWRVWCVFCRDVHLYITYNCSLPRRGKDDSTVDEMLRTAMCLRPG